MSEPDDIGTAPEPARAAKTPLAGRIALWLLGLGALAFVYVLFAATSKPDASGLARFSVGAMSALTVLGDAPAQPSRPFTNASGESMTLAAFRGDVLVVNHWGTFCPPCKAEMPSLAGLARVFEGAGVRVVAISADAAPDRDKARAMLADLSDGALDFYFDPTRGVALDSKAGALPTTVIYDRTGVELARLTGDAKWDSPEAIALVRAVMEMDPAGK